MKTIFYFSPVSWSWIKQRPHFTANYLSKLGYRVTFFSIQTLFNSVLRKHNIVINEDRHNGLKVDYATKLPKIPIRSPLNILLRRKLSAAFSKEYDVTILTSPLQYILKKKLKNGEESRRLVYDCMDYMPGFASSTKSKQEIIHNEAELCSQCDLIICSSDNLKIHIINDYNTPKEKVHVVNNGYEPSVFERRPLNKEQTVYKLKHPNLVYIGTIGKWIDIENITRFASSNPEWFIYLFGPYNSKLKRTLAGCNNIYLSGSVEHEDIALILKNADVPLIPFLIDELVENVDPVKAYEYIASRNNFVSSWWGEMEKFKDFCIFYSPETEGSFEEAVFRARQETFDRTTAVRLLSNATWESRMKLYAVLLSRL